MIPSRKLFVRSPHFTLFRHEPLVVLPADEDTNKRYVVGENRCLAALAILLQLPAAVEAGVSFDFAVPPTEEQLDRLRNEPGFVVPNREEVRKFLGFRHIGGLKTWSPESKARYLEIEIEQAIKDGSAKSHGEWAVQL